MFALLPQFLRGLVGLRYSSIIGDEEDVRVNALVKKVLHIHGELAARADFQPCSKINELYSDLVEISTQPVTEEFSDKVLENPRILEIVHDLRSYCSQIEFNVEKYWSSKAVGPEDSTEQEVYARIQKIPHIDINTILIRDELSAIRLAYQKPIENVAIIGSGPLPLTGLGLIGMLFDAPTNIRTMNIDRELAAVETAKNLCKQLGAKAKGMQFLCVDAGSTFNLTAYDAVYLAILVGNTHKEKEILLKNVASQMKPGALLIVRGATKLKRLMYSVFDPTTKSVAQIMDVKTVVYPKNHYIVDSVIIGQVKAN